MIRIRFTLTGTARQKAVSKILARLSLVALVLAIAVVFWAEQTLDEAAQEKVRQGLILTGLAGLFLFHAIIQFQRRPDEEAERTARANDDLLQRLRWRAVAFNAVLLGLIASVQTAKALSGPPEPRDAFAAFVLLAFCALNLVWLYSRQVPPLQRMALDDELTDFNRARAVSAGFWTFAIAGGGLLGVAWFAPTRLTGVLAIALAGPIVIAGLRFAWLERKAAARA